MADLALARHPSDVQIEISDLQPPCAYLTRVPQPIYIFDRKVDVPLKLRCQGPVP